jgi:hypothetical protein
MKRFALLSMIIFGLVCWMASEAIPCRPLKTEDSGITPAGKPALELSVDSPNWESNDVEHEFCSVFNYGLSERLDAGFEMPFVHINPVDGELEKGLGDIVLRMKYRLINETDSHPAFLIKPTFKIPNGDEEKGLGSGKSDAGILLVLSKSFGNFSGYLNAGYNMLDLPKDNFWSDNTAFLGLGFSQTVNAKFTLLGELTYEPNFNAKRSDDPVDAVWGAAYNLNPAVTLDFALRSGLTDASQNYSVISGVTLNF